MNKNDLIKEIATSAGITNKEAETTLNTMLENIIKALGHIGDPRAIPLLEKLARTFFTFYPKCHFQMKVVLFESLIHYPPQKITTLITIGKKLKDKRISKICERLLAKKNQI